jgi:hypothetical protein
LVGWHFADAGFDAIFFNPAGLTIFHRFEVGADYDYRQYDKTHWAGASLVDSASGAFAAGLDFHMGFTPTAAKTDLSYLGQVSLAYAIVDGILSVGVTGKYAHLPSNDYDMAQGRFTADAGLLFKMPFGLSLAAVGYNLVPVPSKRLPLSVGFGAALNFGGAPGASSDAISAHSGFTLAFDWLMRDLTAKKEIDHQLYTGAEYYIASIVPLRAGYSYSLTDHTHVLSAGAGFMLPILEIDALYQQDIYNAERRVVGGAARFFF